MFTHPRWMFAIFAWVLASAFFSIIALLAGAFLPPVAAAITSRPAQRRYTAMMLGRPPGDGPA